MATTPPRAPRVYRPSLVRGEGGWEQRFDANLLTIEPIDDFEGTLVALAEVDAPKRGPLARGTPIHTLLLQLPDFPDEDGDGEVTFNDEDNQRSIGEHVERVELGSTWLRVVYLPGEGPMASRTSLSPEAELFDLEEGDPPEEALRSVRIGLEAVAEQLDELRATLRQHLGDRFADFAGQGG